MDCADLIVVGSGPGGAFAALGARGRKVVMLDVGITPPVATPADAFAEKIGEQFESLYNLAHPHISLKLKAPGMTYIASRWQELTPVTGAFGGVLSLAKGGLANGWGAGVYRFTERDLEGFPIGAQELLPYYEEAERHMGVCGANDDLTPHFGRDEHLLPPLQLTPFFKRFLGRYERRRDALAREGIAIGRPRLAVLTAPYSGRSAYGYENREFFRAYDPAVYSPAYTVDDLAHAGAIDYRPGLLVTRYRETEAGVEVTCRNLAKGGEERFTARRLALAAGALNTARIVVESNHDYATRLPIYDNPMAVVPFFDLRMVGAAAPERDTSLAQLNLVMDGVQASLYGASGPLRTDVLFGLPFSARANMALTKYLAPAMGAAILFYPGPEAPGNCLWLSKSGALEVHFEPVAPHEAERKMVRMLRRLGYAASTALIQRPAMGAGLHFAGPLPMTTSPRRYETDRNGLLAGTRGVYIVDGACFPRLPAKNLTLTIMANALRIGRHIAGLA